MHVVVLIEMKQPGKELSNELLKDGGARKVSYNAIKELAKILEQDGKKIADSAIALAKRAGRNTIVAEDIKLAQN